MLLLLIQPPSVTSADLTGTAAGIGTADATLTTPVEVEIVLTPASLTFTAVV